MAFNDINEKRDILLEHIKSYSTKNLYEIIDIEKSLDVLKLNGDNNKKFTKDPELLKYVSAARTVKII